MPDAFAGGRIEAHEAFGEQIVAESIAAVVVVGRRAERQVHVAERLVDAHQRPDVRIARVFRRVALPAVVSVLTRLGHRSECPQPLARAHVEAADVAAHHLLLLRSVGDPGAGDHHVAHDDRGRGDGVIADSFDEGEPFGEIDAPACAERRVELAGLCIHRDQVGVVRASEQPLDRTVGPVRKTAVKEPEIRRPAGLPRFRIELPDRLARAWVEGRDDAETGEGVHDTVRHQRRVLVGARLRLGVRRRDRVVGRAPSPRLAQLPDVCRIDLIERRVLRAAGVAAVKAPLVRSGPLGVGHAKHGRRDDAGDDRSSHGHSFWGSVLEARDSDSEFGTGLAYT